MRPVFARTRHNYDSYTDFWRLVELSGFEAIYVDEVRLDSEGICYIFSPANGEVMPHLENELQRCGNNKKAKVVWWNLERMHAGEDPIGQLGNYVDAVWASDQGYASCHPKFSFVVLGSHPNLRSSEPLSGSYPTYDFVHMSYVWGRREGPICELRSNPSLREGPNCWGHHRHKTLTMSKVMLNIHQTPEPYGEPLRFALAAAYKLALVTETLSYPFPLVPEEDFVQVPIDQVACKVGDLIHRDQPRIERIAASLHRRLCTEWTFRRGVEEGVRAL